MTSAYLQCSSMSKKTSSIEMASVRVIKLMNDNVFGEEVLGNGGEVTGESLMI